MNISSSKVQDEDIYEIIKNTTIAPDLVSYSIHIIIF